MYNAVAISELVRHINRILECVADIGEGLDEVTLCVYPVVVISVADKVAEANGICSLMNEEVERVTDTIATCTDILNSIVVNVRRGI